MMFGCGVIGAVSCDRGILREVDLLEELDEVSEISAGSEILFLRF